MSYLLNEEKEFKSLELKWAFCEDEKGYGSWCELLSHEFTSPVFEDLHGVYIIWNSKTVIRIGSGHIKTRLKAHQGNPEIKEFAKPLFTWAKVHQNQMKGVEKYFSKILNPAIGSAFPEKEKIVIANLPDWLYRFANENYVLPPSILNDM